MKREFLKELGVADDLIDKIMEENGKDIEKYKADSETKKQKITDLETQLTDANKQIEDFQGMDIEAVKKGAEEWKTKYETEKTENETKLAKLQYDGAAGEFIKGLNPKDDLSTSALLTEFFKKEFQLKDGVFQGAKEWAEEAKTKYPDHFKGDKPQPTIVAGGGNPSPNTGDESLRAMFGLSTEKK